jgi:hypothetical protein
VNPNAPVDDDPFFAPLPPEPRVSWLVMGRIATRLVYAVIAGSSLLSTCSGTRPSTPSAHSFPAESLLLRPQPLTEVRTDNLWPVLKAGDCLPNIDGAVYDSPPVTIACSQPHKDEVFAVLPINSSTYPGDGQVDVIADLCAADLLKKYANAKKVKRMRVTFLAPNRMSWVVGDHTVSCLVDSATATTGSVRAS